MKKNKTLVLAIVAVVVVLAVVGVVVAKSNSSTTTSSNAPTAADTAAANSAVATTSVAIQNYMFSPMSIKVKVGDTVTWTNKDDVHHTVSSASGSANVLNSAELGQNATYSHKFTTAGTFSYYCMDHPYMKATVVVTN